MKTNPRRILIVGACDKIFGGVEKITLSWLENTDREEYIFDFLSPRESTWEIKRSEIEKNNGKIFTLGVSQRGAIGKIKYYNALKKFLQNNNYDTVHINSGAVLFTATAILACKKNHIKQIIAHSHNFCKPQLKNILFMPIIKKIIEKYATNYATCSDLAAKTMFTKKIIKNNMVRLIPNGIDTTRIRFNEKKRNNTRKELGINEHDVVYGHIGRFQKQKNHKKLIDIFYEIQKNSHNAKLLLIGEGELRGLVEEKIKKYNIQDKVIILNYKDDVSGYLSAMDFFVLPSFYEGLGIVAIEAQSTGLPVFYSAKTIPASIKILEKTKAISLRKAARYWAEEILKTNPYDINEREVAYKKVEKAGYTKEKSTEKLLKLYGDKK